MKIIISITLFLSFFLPGLSANAQIMKEVRNNIDMTGYVSISANWINVASMNNLFESYDYPVFNDVSPAWGGGSRMLYKEKFVIGFDYFNLINQRENHRSYDATFSGSMRLLCFGFCALNRPTLQIYPLFGIGIQSLTFKLTENTSLSFEEMLENPKRGIEISRKDFFIDLGIQFDKFKHGEENRIFLWGVKAGYRFIPVGFRWRYNRSALTDGPDAGIDGAYLQLNFGMRNVIRAIRGK